MDEIAGCNFIIAQLLLEMLLKFFTLSLINISRPIIEKFVYNRQRNATKVYFAYIFLFYHVFTIIQVIPLALVADTILEHFNIQDMAVYFKFMIYFSPISYTGFFFYRQ